MLDEFLSRLPTSATTERQMIADVLGIPANLKTKIDAIRADADLSETAKVRKIKELAQGDASEHLRQLQTRASAMRSEIENLKQALGTPKVDRADMFAESQRRETRDFLRTLSAPERLRMAMTDSVAATAVLTAPHPALSGLPPEQLDQVRKAFVERTSAEQMRGIEQREAIVGIVNDAIRLAIGQFARETGLSERDAA